jgi:Fur family transcriptional regulator, ferric uptake regulator
MKTPFQRSTAQRQLILEELRGVHTHPTAVELFDLVRVRLPKISLGTVYRNLERLAQAGMIAKMDKAGGEARFDGNIEPHDHLRCVRCGRVDDAPAQAPLDLSSVRADDFGGYEILGHRLTFLGVCPRCRGNETPQPKGE